MAVTCIGNALLLSAAALEVSISTLTGDHVIGDLLKIDANVATLGDGGALPLAGLRTIQFPSGARSSEGIQTVFLSCGSVIFGSGARLNEAEEITLQLPGGIAAAFPIDAVRGVRLLSERRDSLFERMLAGEGDRENDRVYVPQGAELRELTGILESLTNDQVTLDRDGALVELPRDKVYGILFAAALEPDLDGFNAIVRTAEGSTLRGSISSFADGVLHLNMVDAAKIALPAGHIVSIRLQPPNLLYASDLEPASAVAQPVLAPVREWRRDRNVAGGELRLGPRAFEKGIGMAAGTRLAFENPGTFITFTALIGIDSGRAKRGDCEIVVLGDGRELTRHRLRGGDEAVALNLNISSVSEIILSVEPGEDYDLSDHVNWCEAAFLKK